MKLMIIESPGKLKKLREILSKIRPHEQWQVEASVGHVRDLPAKGQGPNELTTGVRSDFMPVYELTERGQQVVERLRGLVKRADAVYLATDPDREGESISWHLKEALQLQKHSRVSFNEISESKVAEALLNPGQIDMRRVSSQEARRVLDRLVGYLVSSELRRQTGQGLSAGRVQSVAVYLVVKREREIRAFKVTAHFGAQLFFAGAKKSEEWSAEWITRAGFTTEEHPYFMNRAITDQVAAMRDLVVESFEEKEATRQPPAPFTTSTLQQAASNGLGWSPDKTMQTAQRLYEQGHISYHRTDNPNVSDDAMPHIRAVAAAMQLEVVSTRRQFKAKEDAQEGHPAITPAHWDLAEAGEDQDQQALYALIRIRAIASQLLAARYQVRTATLRSRTTVEQVTALFGASGRTLVDPGWLRLLADDQAEEEEAEAPNNPVPVLRVGQQLTAARGETIEKKTRAPKRYTEASLIKALEAEGIGRPATYAAIMKNIVQRGYIAVRKRFLHPEQSGEFIVGRLEGAYSFLDVGFTRVMERDLDGIATGATRYRLVIEGLYSTLATELKAQQAETPVANQVALYACPTCGKALRRINGQHGPFWSCTGRPECDVTLPDAKGKPGERKTVLSTEFSCGTCGKPLVHRKKKGKAGYDFWGCSGFREGCKTSYPNLKGKPDFAKSKTS